MTERLLYQEWHAQWDTTKYPFSDRATLTNSYGRILTEGLFLDAALYPVGGGSGLYLAQVDIDHQLITLTIGTPSNRNLITGSLPLTNAPDNTMLTDSYGRPAGILVSETARLGIFQSWGVGSHVFKPAESEFAATVCFPTPDIGVRGIQLPDGTLLTGDVYLIGSDGVVFRTEEVELPAGCEQTPMTVKAIRMDVVGDPLFRRRLCAPNSLFATPRFVKSLHVNSPYGTFDCFPDADGNLQITVNNALAADTILRVVTTPNGIQIDAVGAAQPGQA